MKFVVTILLFVSAFAVFSNAQGCVTDLENTVSALVTAGKDIGAAVTACRQSKTACVAAIDQVVSDISQATNDVSHAASDCGTFGPQCAADIGTIANDLNDVSGAITKASTDCQSIGLNCIIDVAQASIDIGKLILAGRSAITDCKAPIASVSTSSSALTLKRPTSSFVNSSALSICSLVGQYLPSACQCRDDPTAPRSLVECDVSVLGDQFQAILTIEPCAAVADIALEVQESDIGLDVKLGPWKAGITHQFSIPGLSFKIIDVGSVGAVADVTISGNAASLRLNVGVDACGKVFGFNKCGADLTSELPFTIINHTFNFGQMCSNWKQLEQDTGLKLV